MPVAPHWHANLHVAPRGRLHRRSIAVEHFDLGKDIYNFETVVAPESGCRAADGHIGLPEGPGLGSRGRKVAMVLIEYSGTRPSARWWQKVGNVTEDNGVTSVERALRLMEALLDGPESGPRRSPRSST